MSLNLSMVRRVGWRTEEVLHVNYVIHSSWEEEKGGKEGFNPFFVLFHRISTRVYLLDTKIKIWLYPTWRRTRPWQHQNTYPASINMVLDHVCPQLEIWENFILPESQLPCLVNTRGCGEVKRARLWKRWAVFRIYKVPDNSQHLWKAGHCFRGSTWIRNLKLSSCIWEYCIVPKYAPSEQRRNKQ